MLGAAGASGLYQFNEIGAGHGGGAATLGLEGKLARPQALSPVLGARLRELGARLDELDLVTDLGTRIGSREWLRGLVACTALCCAAWSFAPGLEPLPAPAPAPLSDAQWEEARTLSIAPLALGSDTGRRMAPTEAVEPLTDTPERPQIELRATLGRGDGFARALERAGLGRETAAEVAQLVAAALPLDEVKPGTSAEITLGRRPNKRVARPLDLLAFRARFDLRVAVERVDGKLALRKIPISVDDTPLRIQGRVGSSLYRAARAAGAPARAIQDYLRALGGQLNVGSIGADDRFDIIIEHRRAETGETEVGRLLYAGLDRSGARDLQLMQWEQGGRAQWFEASGVGKTTGMLQRPVPGQVTSNFGTRRHPILGYTRMHKGMDFRAGYGTPILAATEGRVAGAGRAGGYGKQVRLKHAGGLVTTYSHMSRIATEVGAFVKQGQVIGYVGSTGLSTGPHLHYELYRNGVAVNPASVKFTTKAQLNGRDLASFKARLRGLLGVPVSGSPKEADSRSAEAPKKSPGQRG